jgi:hypothetical protein
VSRNLQDVETIESVSCESRDGSSVSKTAKAPSGDSFHLHLARHLNPQRDLVRLGDAMEGSEIERSFLSRYASTTSWPSLPPQLVAELLYPQLAYDCPDKIAVNTWGREPLLVALHR